MTFSVRSINRSGEYEELLLAEDTAEGRIVPGVQNFR